MASLDTRLTPQDAAAGGAERFAEDMQPRPLAALTVLAACAGHPEPRSAAPDIAAPDGPLVYRGVVAAEGEGEVGYWYRRHVEGFEDGSQRSIHRSFARDDRGGAAPLVEQVVAHDERYALVSYAEQHHQLEMHATIVVTPDRLQFERTQRGRTTQRSVPRVRDVVVGPTLFGYLLGHEAELGAGETLDFDFAVATRASTYRFFATEQPTSGESRRFRVRCRSIVLRWAIGDLIVDFDPATQRVTSYEGPVPLVDARGRGLRAHVHYSYPEGSRYR